MPETATTTTTIERYRAPLEIGALALTGAVHLGLHTQPQLHLIFVVAAIVGWSGYAVANWFREPAAVRGWGLGREGLSDTLIVTLPLAAMAAVTMVAWGRLQGVGMDPWMLLPLALYPIWGVIQQLLIQGMLARNLDDAGMPKLAVVIVAAAAFGLVHWPYPALMLATTLMGLVFTPIYLRFRNIWALGLWHGWLGTLLYQFVLQRHPIHDALGLG